MADRRCFSYFLYSLTLLQFYPSTADCQRRSGVIVKQPEISNSPHQVVTTFDLFDLQQRQECPVPCGYSQQLCCNSNEICYTAPNLEAECSATALPSPPTTVVSTSVVTTAETSSATITLDGSSITIQQTLTHTLISTSPAATITDVSTQTTTNNITQTAPITSTRVTTGLNASLGADGASAAPANNTEIPRPTQDGHHSMTKKEQGGIAGGVLGVLAIVGIVVWWLVRWYRKRGQHRQAGMEFREMDQSGLYRQTDTARMQETNAESIGRRESFYLAPDQHQQSRSQLRPNPYADVGEEVPEIPAEYTGGPPSYETSPLNSGASTRPPQRMYGNSRVMHPERDVRYSGAPQSDRPRMTTPSFHIPPARTQQFLRRPVPGRSTTVEEFNG